MKISKILFETIIIALLIIICNSSMCYAEHVPVEDYGGGGTPTEESEGGNASSSVGLPDIDSFKPELDTGDSAIDVISILLGVLRTVGIIVFVVSIALIGFNTILGSASEKAAGAEKYVGLMIAAALLTGGSWIAETIMSVAESL